MSLDLSLRDSSIGWELRFMKRRSLVQILILILCGHIKKEKMSLDLNLLTMHLIKDINTK
jgi:hypothetical protein